MKPIIDTVGTGKRLGVGLALVSALAFLAILGITGCTSEEPNMVGIGLVTDQFDTVLVPLEVETVSRYSALNVSNEDILMHQQHLAYMGEQMGTRSSIIANFDFGFSDDTVPRNKTRYPDSLFTVENIKSVKLSLVKPTYYHAFTRVIEDEDTLTVATGQPTDLYYLVRELDAPFDSTLYDDGVDNEVPPFQSRLLNQDFFEANSFDEPFLRMYPEDFMRWFDAGAPMGLLVSLDAPSDSGLVGYGTRETKKFSEFSDLQVGTLVGPNFQVEFANDYVDTFNFYLMGAYADASTFDQVPDAPSGPETEILLRTGLRSYPALTFDLSGLPPHAFINRALLSITNNPEVSFGQLSHISVLEWDEGRYGDPYRDMELGELVNDQAETGPQRYSFHITGNTTQDPNLDETIKFDVTQAVLRVINQVYSGTRGFILTGGENRYPYSIQMPRPAVTPDFYYREFRFMGTAAADPAHRPRLEITYSLVDELEKGGE